MIKADVAVVGAGLVGLATALYLVERDPSLDVAVLDAADVAAGASGHGTGLLGPRVGPPIDRARTRFGDATARRMYLASADAVAQVCRLVDRWQLDCDLRRGPQLVVARSVPDAGVLRAQARAYRDLGLDVPLLSAAALGEHVDVPYHAGLLYRDAATLDPSAFTRGLAAAAEAKGVRLYRHTPVTGLDRAGGGPVLALGTGLMRARAVVLALNAYAPGLRLPVGTVLPLVAHAVATAPLDPSTFAALGGPGGYAVIDVNPLAPYYRTTPDRRLIAGGGRPGLVGERAKTLDWLTDRVHALHPGLVRADVVRRWSGRIAMTADGLPVVGRVAGHPDVWYAGGCNGHGLAMSVAHAGYLAEAVCTAGRPDSAGRTDSAGRPAALLPWHRDRAPWLPVGAATRPLLRAHLAMLDRRARRS